jgi:hypothetical protein
MTSLSASILGRKKKKKLTKITKKQKQAGFVSSPRDVLMGIIAKKMFAGGPDGT